MEGGATQREAIDIFTRKLRSICCTGYAVAYGSKYVRSAGRSLLQNVLHKATDTGGGIGEPSAHEDSSALREVPNNGMCDLFMLLNLYCF